MKLPPPLHNFWEYEAAKRSFANMKEEYMAIGLSMNQKLEFDELNLRILRFENKTKRNKCLRMLSL